MSQSSIVLHIPPVSEYCYRAWGNRDLQELIGSEGRRFAHTCVGIHRCYRFTCAHTPHSLASSLVCRASLWSFPSPYLYLLSWSFSPYSLPFWIPSSASLEITLLREGAMGKFAQSSRKGKLMVCFSISPNRPPQSNNIKDNIGGGGTFTWQNTRHPTFLWKNLPVELPGWWAHGGPGRAGRSERAWKVRALPHASPMHLCPLAVPALEPYSEPPQYSICTDSISRQE